MPIMGRHLKGPSALPTRRALYRGERSNRRGASSVKRSLAPQPANCEVPGANGHKVLGGWVVRTLRHRAGTARRLGAWRIFWCGSTAR